MIIYIVKVLFYSTPFVQIILISKTYNNVNNMNFSFWNLIF